MVSKLFQAIGLDTFKPRDRIALLAGGLAILFSLLQFLIIQPLHRQIDHLTHLVSNQAADLQWMQQAAEEIIRLRKNATIAGEGAPHAESLLIIVGSSAKKVGISQTMKRIEPIGEEGVRVWIEEVPFDDLLRWLGDLRARGVHSDNIAIERRKTPGHVNTKATLGWL